MPKLTADDLTLIAPAALAALPDGDLFYPAAGSDIDVPIALFRDYVSAFWFVDQYLYDNEKGRGIPTPKGATLLREEQSQLTGTTLRRLEPFTVAIRTREYAMTDFPGPIRVHFCCGRGYDSFRAVIRTPVRPLSVFFYRGDSAGEGGSGFRWLNRKRLRNVVDALRPNGLIVSDGSHAVEPLRRFHRQNGLSAEPRRLAQPFRFRGREFVCVGYAGDRYGPTLIWQVRPLANPAASRDHRAT